MRAMTQTLVTVVFFVVLLAIVPFGINWVQRHSAAGSAGMGSAAKVISAVAVGPHQRVVTVEVGPEGARTWLTLGVTAQTITCLHSTAVETKSGIDSPQAIENTPVLS